MKVKGQSEGMVTIFNIFSETCDSVSEILENLPARATVPLEKREPTVWIHK